jgi:tryptophanyl-tRNA synthetase
MMTNPQRVKRTDSGDPELSPVFQLHKIFSTKQEQDEVAEGCRTAGIGCIDCKKILIKNLFSVLEPIWEKRGKFLNKPEIIKEIIDAGSLKAREIASNTIAEATRAIRLNALM